MNYTLVGWKNNQSPPISAENLNHMDEQIRKNAEEFENFDNKKSSNQKFANALKGTANGVSISVVDASPIEHELSIKVESKNRINIESAFLNDDFAPYLTEPTTDNSTLRFEKKYDGNISVGCSVYAYLEAGTYVFSGIGETNGDGNMAYIIYNPDGSQLGGTVTIGKTYQEFKHSVTVSQSGKYTFVMYIGWSAANGSYVSYKNLLLEKGETQTEYTPFVYAEDIAVSKLIDGVEVQSETPSADGTVKGFTSSPSFELISSEDDGSVLINLEYNRDINKISFGDGTDDGFSPIAKVEETENGAVITIIDKNGTTSATVTNGKDGKDGADGTTQLTPLFANSIEECTDTSKLYVLPDGFIYAYMAGSETGQGSEELSVNWNDNYRLSTSDGGLRSGATGYTASESIDLSVLKNVGDTLTVTGISFSTANTSRSIALFGDNAFVQSYFPSPTATFPMSNSGVTVMKLDSAETTLLLERVAECTDGKTYTIALCGYGSGANAVVTHTGEVTMDGVMDWRNTGHAFVPADYEDRIITLEADNAYLKEDNKALKTRVKALEDTALYGDSIPDYVLMEAEEVADKVLAVRNADSFVMALASDFHTNGEDISSVSVLHAGQGMNAINSMTQLDLVALLGDYEIYGFSYGDADTDGEDARKSFKHIKKAFSSIAKGVPFMQLQGNHDELPADTTEEAQQKYYAYIGANNVGTVTDYNNKFRNYGYRDFENYKIRVIYLNSADVSDSSVTGSCYVSTEQLNWLNTVALNLTDSEWGIIVLSHHPLNWTGMSVLLNVLDEYKGNGEGAELIAHFHGHLHNFRAETLGTNGVPTITIPNACFGRNNEYGTSSSYSDSIKTAYGDTDESGNQRVFEKTADTAEDTAFNIITVDRKNRKIYAHCYGAGIDREISY